MGLTFFATMLFEYQRRGHNLYNMAKYTRVNPHSDTKKTGKIKWKGQLTKPFNKKQGGTQAE